MAKFRVEKTKNYTVMANYFFRDKRLSWKAKGLLAQMMSLPDDWDYSLDGLVTLATDGASATRTALKELETFGYLRRQQVRDNGRIIDWEYLIFEQPQCGFPLVENQQVGNPQVGNQRQLNNNKLNTKELSTKEQKGKAFVPPSEAEVEAYCKERNNKINSGQFIDYYTSNGWKVGRTQMRDWKAAIRNWERRDTPKVQAANIGGVEIERRRYAEEELNGLFTILDD